MFESFCESLAMVPNGKVKKLQRMSTKSFPASANTTLLLASLIRSLSCTYSSVSVVSAMAEEQEFETIVNCTKDCKLTLY
jgi:hypothetical protein